MSEAEDLLYDGAVELFNKKQTSSGTDLSKLYIEVLEKRDERTEDEREKVRVIKLIDVSLPIGNHFKLKFIMCKLEIELNFVREHPYMTSDDFGPFLTYLPTLIR